MLKTSYKSIYRVHNVQEALTFKIGKSQTDMLLYFVDLYDVLLSIQSGEIDSPSLEKIVELRMKCTEYLLEHYHDLYKPIPGVLLGWTSSMLIFIIILHLTHLQYDGSSIFLSRKHKDYIMKHRLRVYQNPDPETWCLATYVSFLDAVIFRWKTLTPSNVLNEILEVLWRLAAKFTLNIHSKIILNIESYTESVKGMNHHVRLSEKCMIMNMASFYWLTSTLSYFNRWKRASCLTCPTLGNTKWKTFIVAEKRHFVTRRFRDNLMTFLFEKIILYGDKEMTAPLGEEVSAMTSLYQRAPAGYLNKLNKMVTYDEYEDIIKHTPTKDWVHLIMINQHFMNTYNVKFLSYFFIDEQKMYKHLQAVERSIVPLILYRFSRFEVFFEGKVYTHPQSNSVAHAFVLWCYMLRKHCKSRAFAMDFEPVCQRLLDKDEVVDNTRIVEGMFDLEDD